MSEATENREQCQSWTRSELNPKYPRMVREFIDKGILWNSVTTPECIRRIENDFQFYPDDVILATYPKSGTTLLQEMVWLLTHNVDLDTAHRIAIDARIPFIEHYRKAVFPGCESQGPIYPLDYLSNMPCPRLIKTHLPYRYLSHHLERQPRMKIILCLRNPKDTVVSFYHFYKGIKDFGFSGSWNEYLEMWMDGWISGGNWLEFVTEWDQALQQHPSNLLLVKYEDMVKHPLVTLDRLSQFLNINLTQNQLDLIVQNTRFEVMRDNPMTNYSEFESSEQVTKGFKFLRKGQVGDWRNWFTVAQNDQFDRVYQPALQHLKLKFDFGDDQLGVP